LFLFLVFILEDKGGKMKNSIMIPEDEIKELEKENIKM